MASSCFPLCWAGWRSATGSLYVCICTVQFPPTAGLTLPVCPVSSTWKHKLLMAQPCSSCWCKCPHRCTHTQSIHLKLPWSPVTTPQPTPIFEIPWLPDHHTDLVAHLVGSLLVLTQLNLHTCFSVWHHGHPCRLRSHSSFWHWHPPTVALAVIIGYCHVTLTFLMLSKVRGCNCYFYFLFQFKLNFCCTSIHLLCKYPSAGCFSACWRLTWIQSVFFSCLFFCSCISSCSLSLLYSFTLCSFCIRRANMNIFCQCKTCDVNRIQEILELWKPITQIIRQKFITSDVPELLKLSNAILGALL